MTIRGFDSRSNPKNARFMILFRLSDTITIIKSLSRPEGVRDYGNARQSLYQKAISAPVSCFFSIFFGKCKPHIVFKSDSWLGAHENIPGIRESTDAAEANAVITYCMLFLLLKASNCKQETLLFRVLRCLSKCPLSFYSIEVVCMKKN